MLTENVIIIIIPANSHTFQILKKEKNYHWCNEQRGKPENNGNNYNKSTNNKSDWVYFE